jgi:hypothetical protein
MSRVLAKKIFAEIYESTPGIANLSPQPENEGIVTSVNEFLRVLQEAHDNWNKTFSIPDTDKLIIVEDIPRELVVKLNNQSSEVEIDDTTLRDLRIVTYSASETPAVVSAHRMGEDGIRSLKFRPVGIYDDPNYTGYSIIRFAKDIEAIIDFKVWGIDFFDIRKRSRLLREIINDSIWYFKHKGLREIVWMGSHESDMWDNKTFMKMKSEKYLIRFSEIRETKEKKLEQIVIQAGIS